MVSKPKLTFNERTKICKSVDYSFSKLKAWYFYVYSTPLARQNIEMHFKLFSSVQFPENLWGPQFLGSSIQTEQEGGMEERRGAVGCYSQEAASHHRQIKYLQEMSGGCQE